MIKADKLHPIEIYPPIGMRSADRQAVDPTRPRAARSGSSATATRSSVYMTAVRSHFTPDIIRVKKGDHVHLHITNIEQAKDATHGFALDGYNINLSLEPGEHDDVDFVRRRARRVPVLLHRVLLGAAPGDGRLLAGRAREAPPRPRRSDRHARRLRLAACTLAACAGAAPRADRGAMAVARAGGVHPGGARRRAARPRRPAGPGTRCAWRRAATAGRSRSPPGSRCGGRARRRDRAARGRHGGHARPTGRRCSASRSTAAAGSSTARTPRSASRARAPASRA